MTRAGRFARACGKAPRVSSATLPGAVGRKDTVRKLKILYTSDVHEMCIRDRDNSKGLDEDELMMLALDAGAADVESEGDVAVIYTDPNDFSTVRDNLEAAGCTFLSAEREMVPTTTTEITDPDTLAKVRKLIDWLEDYDDSQNVFHDAELPEEEEEE